MDDSFEKNKKTKTNIFCNEQKQKQKCKYIFC